MTSGRLRRNAGEGRSGACVANRSRARRPVDDAHRQADARVRPRPVRDVCCMTGYLGPAPRPRVRERYAIEEAGGIVCPPRWAPRLDAPGEAELAAERRKLRVTTLLSGCAVVLSCVGMRALAWALGA